VRLVWPTSALFDLRSLEVVRDSPGDVDGEAMGERSGDICGEGEADLECVGMACACG